VVQFAQIANLHSIVRIESIDKSITMDAVLRQSKAMCPFLKNTAPATLRALSTTTRPQASQCGGTISKLQLLGQRCPVMGKALAIQSARVGCKTPMAGASTVSGVRALSGHSKAKIHTSRAQEARAVDAPMFAPRDSG
jgi:5-aminolevulinate synthase